MSVQKDLNFILQYLVRMHWTDLEVYNIIHSIANNKEINFYVNECSYCTTIKPGSIEPDISENLKQTNQDMENSNLTWTVSLQESHEMLPSLALINKNFAPNSPSLINSYYDSSLMIKKARQEISVANVKFS